MGNVRTVKEVDSIRLEQVVRELKHRPHVRRDVSQLEGERIDEVVHVVEQVQQLRFEREHHDGDDDLLDLRQDLGRRVDSVHNGHNGLRDTHSGERLVLVSIVVHHSVVVKATAVGLLGCLALLSKASVRLALWRQISVQLTS